MTDSSADIRPLHAIAVYCGSSRTSDPRYVLSARSFAEAMADAGIELVYGGGNVGLMGEIADAALARGGRVVGVIPTFMQDAELAHHGLSELITVDSMHSRKAIMATRADAFVALPGGYGTLDELFEALTWTQIGLQAKPCGLLNAHGFYDALISFVDHAHNEGFVRKNHRDLLVAAESPAVLLKKLRSVKIPDGAILQAGTVSGMA